MKSLMTSIAAAGLLATVAMAQTSHPGYSIARSRRGGRHPRGSRTSSPTTA